MSRSWGAGVALVTLVCGTAGLAAPRQSPGAPTGAIAPAGDTRTPDSPRALLNKYCVTCHSNRLKTGGLVLEGLDLRDVGSRAELWEKVTRKVHSGTMPPAGQPRPARADLNALASSLE